MRSENRVMLAMLVAGFFFGMSLQSAVAQDARIHRVARIGQVPADSVSSDVAQVAGRGAMQPHTAQSLSRHELFSILLLISQRQAVPVRS